MTDGATRYPPPKHQSEWLSRKEAAGFLTELGCPFSVRTLELATWRDGKGPPYNKIIGKVVYSRTDLRDWARKNTKRVE